MGCEQSKVKAKIEQKVKWKIKLNIKFKENYTTEQTENFISKLILPDHTVFHPKNKISDF